MVAGTLVHFSSTAARAEAALSRTCNAAPSEAPVVELVTASFVTIIGYSMRCTVRRCRFRHFDSAAAVVAADCGGVVDGGASVGGDRGSVAVDAVGLVVSPFRLLVQATSAVAARDVATADTKHRTGAQWGWPMPRSTPHRTQASRCAI